MFGGIILLVNHGMWFIALQIKKSSEILMLLFWGLPAIAAFLTAYLAPDRKIILGISMALWSAILSGILNIVYESLGNAVDFSGVSGMLIVIFYSLVSNGIFCTLGATLGYFLSRK